MQESKQEIEKTSKVSVQTLILIAPNGDRYEFEQTAPGVFTAPAIDPFGDLKRHRVAVPVLISRS